MPPTDAIYAALCEKDREYWQLNHAVIDAEAGEVSYAEAGGLRLVQRKINALRYHCEHIWHVPIRILTLKYRQGGLSTDEQAFQYWRVKYKHQSGAVIAHNADAAQYIFEKFDRYYRHDPFSPPVFRLSSTRRVVAKHGTGRYEVGTAKSPDALRSRTLDLIHGSEVAYWEEEGPKLHKAIMKFVKNRQFTSVNYETTANGEDPLFHPMWINAIKHCKLEFIEDPSMPYQLRIERTVTDPEGTWNNFHPLFLSVLDDERATMECTEDEGRHIRSTAEEEEQWLIEKGISDEFLKWRRVTIATECNGDINDFHQEYPITWQQAFIASGHPRFRYTILDRMPVEPGLRGFLRREQRWLTRINFITEPNSDLTIFRHFVEGHRYIVAVDPSQGIPTTSTRCEYCSGDRDETSVQVFDIDAGGKLEQVALMHGPIDSEELVDPLITICTYYNSALLVIETVGGHGEHLVFECRKHYDPARLFTMDGRRTPGLVVGPHRHNAFMDDVASLLHNEMLILHAERTIHQLRVVKRVTGGRYEATEGHHDDDVTAMWGIAQGWLNYPAQLIPRDVLSQPIRRRTEEATYSGNPDPSGFY